MRTGSELVSTRPQSMVDPVMGEILDLRTAEPVRLGQVLLDIRDLELRLREAKGILSDELHARMDLERVWTIHAGDLKLTGKSDAPVVEWDVEGVIEELDVLVLEGLLSPEGRNRAIRTTVKHEVVAVGMNALLKSHVFAERLAPYCRWLPPDGRRVSVSRA